MRFVIWVMEEEVEVGEAEGEEEGDGEVSRDKSIRLRWFHIV